jgi:hypothetical protein
MYESFFDNFESAQKFIGKIQASIGLINQAREKRKGRLYIS